METAKAGTLSVKAIASKSTRAQQRRVRTNYMRSQRGGAIAAGKTQIATSSTSEVITLKTV